LLKEGFRERKPLEDQEQLNAMMQEDEENEINYAKLKELESWQLTCKFQT